MGGDAYSPDERASLTTERASSQKLALTHRITFVEAARREVEFATGLAGSRINEEDRLILAMKLAVAAEVDAGRLTPEMADYRVQERIAALHGAEQARRIAAVQALGEAM